MKAPKRYQDCLTIEDKQAWFDRFHLVVLAAWYGSMGDAIQATTGMPHDVAVNYMLEGLSERYADFRNHHNAALLLDEAYREQG